MRTVDLQWLFEQSHPVPFSGCWVWTGSLQGGGYARIMTDGRMQPAHRVAYELKHGPIPDGLEMDHLCRVRCCVNPDHLEAVTTSVNQLRGNAPSVVAARNRTPEMRAAASQPKSAEHKAKLRAPKSPEHASKLRVMLTKRNQSAEMRAIASLPKAPEHREAIRQAQLARNRK